MQHEHRMTVQRTLFAGPDPRVVPGMYVDADLARIRPERTALRLEPGAVVSTNTYFGRFAASYWQRYTAVTDVRLTLHHACGPQTLLRLDVVASDASGRRRPLQTREITCQGEVSVDLEIRRFVDGGGIWFELTAIGGGAQISEVTWSVPAPERDRRISVVMCTYDRPAEAISTLLTLGGDAAAADLIDAVHVVDQGTRRVEDHDEFHRVKSLLGDRLHYVTQPNLGGAGGFNRGIRELTRSGECSTDIVVMDDDILCEPESVIRLSAMSANATRPILVGSQMLLLSETYRVHMTGEWEALDELKAGRPSANGRNGLDALTDQQDVRTDAGWNGWWSCLLPAEAVAAVGLSLPLFFQWDDIEFGIRARKAGFPTVTLPNAGVWHADFHLKDYNDWTRYFSWRNAMIVSAIHGRFDPKQISGVVAREITQHIVSMQYGLAETFLLAVRDFISGPSVLHDGGQAKLGELARLRADYPDTVRVDAATGLAADPPIVVKGPDPQRDRLDQVLAKRVVKQYLGRLAPGRVAISAHDNRWWHVGLFAEAVVTDSSQTGVRIRRRDKGIAVRQARELARLCLELRRRGPELAEMWRSAVPELTGPDNWQRLFDGE
ncbi:glycosyltransferase family 2 protein [Gordonia desulfuricans]|uniref:Glycosyltransferase family 2 protein n=2 Tax=Gordonia desulfuricans TaxID=89051 RepID=A0A7K3LPG9_9ACTN|nr:glycosyltransferase family 2 protein [Gordonia desulfuricans]